jgi:divalent metal cation (Fe/Co/Zn/Cd) transporter
MITPATTAALIAANSVNHHCKSDPKAFLAILIAINLICFCIWLYFIIEYYAKRIKNEKIINYVFDNGLTKLVSVVFIVTNLLAIIILFVGFIIKLL